MTSSLLIFLFLQLLCISVSPTFSLPSVSHADGPSSSCPSCHASKTCAGPLSDRRCVTPMAVGKPCNSDPYWICAAGLTCKSNFCRSSVCPPCPASKVCAGPDDDKRCVSPMPKGKPCGSDPFWLCAAGLKCKNGFCRSDKCHKCYPGKMCAGPEDDKRCVHPMPKGKPCGSDPFWVCAKGLTCKNAFCRSSKCHKCYPGKLCAGPEDDKRCVQPMPEGMPCGTDPFWVCERGSTCKDGFCRTPTCKKCFPGKVCVGPEDDKRCVDPMRKGKPCGGDPFWVCAKGLKCRAGFCRSSKCQKCAPGKVCAGTEDDKRCVKPMIEGKPCGSDPFWVCKEGLVCRKEFCRVASDESAW